MKEVSALFIMITLSFPGCKIKTLPVSVEEAIKVRTTMISHDTLSIPVHSTGIITSDQEIKLSFKTGGIIAEITVKEGARVKKGDLLASLNLSEINAQVNQAKNSYDKAFRDFTRAQNLYRDSVATLEQFQNASTALNVAKSNLEISQYNLVHSIITAPENGVILKQLSKTNELVGSGYPVFLFGSSGKNWKIKAGFSDKEIVKINPGDSAKFVIDAWPDVNFAGVVIQVGEMSNPFTGGFEVELNLNDKGYRLASGFVTGVDIFPSKKERYTLVPVGAIIEADEKTGYVYVVNKAMTVRKIKINILTITGSKVAIKGIPGGINEIVSEGAAYLRDGVKVKVVK